MCIIYVVAGLLPQRLKSTYFEISLHSGRVSFGDPPLEIFSKMLILTIEANNALSCQNDGLFFRILAQYVKEKVLLHTAQSSIRGVFPTCQLQKNIEESFF